MTSNDTPLSSPIRFDPETGTHRTSYEWSSPVPLSIVIVEVVADVLEVDPRNVSRLRAGIDPEALDAAFDPAPDGETRREGCVSFRLDECQVTVRGDGEIIVEVVEGK